MPMNTPPGQGASVAEQLQAQIVAMQDTMNAMQMRLAEAEDEIRRNGARGIGGRGHDRQEEELVSKKFFDPEPFTSKDVWREWSEDFVDFISGRPGSGETLASNLEQARIRTAPYESMGSNEEQVRQSKMLYRVLKKLIRRP